MIPATIYLMGIILNLAMDKKWSARLGSLARRSCICISNHMEKSALAQITVTAAK